MARFFGFAFLDILGLKALHLAALSLPGLNLVWLVTLRLFVFDRVVTDFHLSRHHQGECDRKLMGKKFCVEFRNGKV